MFPIVATPIDTHTVDINLSQTLEALAAIILILPQAGQAKSLRRTPVRRRKRGQHRMWSNFDEQAAVQLIERLERVVKQNRLTDVASPIRRIRRLACYELTR